MRTKIYSSFRETLELLTPSEKRNYQWLVALRTTNNLLDVLAIGALGLIVSSREDGPSGSLRRARDYLVPSLSDQNFLAILALLSLSLLVLKSVNAAVLSNRLLQHLARTEARLARDVYLFIFSSDLQRLRTFSHGRMLWATHSSTQQAITGYLAAISSLVADITLLIMTGTFLIVVSPVLGPVLVAYLGVAVFVFQSWLSPRSQEVGREVAESSEQVAQNIQDSASVYREVRLKRLTEPFSARFQIERRRYAEASASQTFFASLPRHFLEISLALPAVVAVLWLATVGEIDDFLFSISVYLVVGLRLAGALSPIQSALTTLKSLSGQASSARKILQEAQKPATRNPSLPRSRGVAGPARVEFRGVEISLTEDGRRIGPINFICPPGTITAISGPSGGGKSRLVEVVLGFIGPDKGKMLIDDLDAREFIEYFSAEVAYVPQFTGLIRGSLIDNLRLGLPDEELADERVWEALRRANLSDWVQSLPEGVHTHLGNLSDRISGGQRKRLGIARALLSQPGLIVLDEPTAGLDAPTELGILRTVAELKGGSTVILISHSQAAVKLADKTLSLAPEFGKI